VQKRFGRLMRLLAHDLFDALPLLDVAGLRDAEQSDMSHSVLRPARREADRDIAFRRLVDDDEEFARAAGGAHLGQFCLQLIEDFQRLARAETIGGNFAQGILHNA